MCSPLIQNVKNVNISFEICANVFGSRMDPYKDLTWILCGGAAGRSWILIRILYGCRCRGLAGRHGSVETENGVLAYGGNEFYIKLQILHWKYV